METEKRRLTTTDGFICAQTRMCRVVNVICSLAMQLPRPSFSLTFWIIQWKDDESRGRRHKHGDSSLMSCPSVRYQRIPIARLQDGGSAIEQWERLRGMAWVSPESQIQIPKHSFVTNNKGSQDPFTSEGVSFGHSLQLSISSTIKI